VPRIIGLDLGTTTITGVLLDTGQGISLSSVRAETSAQRLNDSALKPTRPARAEQDPQRLRSLALEVLSELADRNDRVDGIAVTGQMHGLICLDISQEPLTPLVSWQDQRTAEALSDGTNTLQHIHARLKDLEWRENGCRLAHGYGAATLFWRAQQDELPSTTRSICTLPDWLAGQLGGQPPVTDPTLAASWGVYSLVRGCWNTDLLGQLGLDARLLPPVRRSGERVGSLVSGIACSVGLPDGIPVFNALGDNQASFLGCITEPEQSLLLNLGTGGQICWMRPGFESPTEAVETRPLPDRQTLRVGATLCGGAAYAWLTDTIRAWLAEFGMRVHREAVYERLRVLAAASEDTAGLAVRTAFLGSRGDLTVTAGAIEGITLDNLQLGPLARATWVGVVEELHALYESTRGPNMHSCLVATGGAARKNPLLLSIIEDRFGLPVEVPRFRETAAVGAALLAACRGQEQKIADPHLANGLG
jgi:sedoheptulokinase